MSHKDTERRLTCQVCGGGSRCVRSIVVYGRDYGGWIYVCEHFPRCDTFVGCHKGTKIPLGDMADKETRTLRKQVHARFDPLWKAGHCTREDAYAALAEAMLISIGECHVGMFSALRCRAALDCITRIRAALLHPSVESVGANYVAPDKEVTEVPF